MRVAQLASLALVALAPQEELGGGLSFRGTPAEALASVERLSDLGEAGRAIKIATEFAHDEEAGEPLRAEFHYAIGVVRSRHQLASPAEDAFLSARALAGPGELRLDATYDAGTLRLQRGELLWSEFLQSGGQPAPGRKEAEDPLGPIRAAFLAAKELLIERLRGDWRDDDTRANLELIQRRLRMIDALEQMQQEEEQPDPNESSDEEGEQGDPNESGDEQQGPPEDQEGGEQPPAEGDPNRDESEDGAGEQPQPQPGELPDVDPQQVAAEQDAERHMSREDVMRLLDKLQQLEEEQRLLEALLRERRRIPVEKDW